MSGRALAIATSLGLLASCSFPTVSFTSDDAPIGDAGGPLGDATIDDAGAHDGTTRDGGATGDGGASDDGASATDAARDAAYDGGPCDRDNDGYLATGPTCQGDDCDDNDARRHPDAGWSDIPTDAGDWNCDGHVDKLYPPKINCGNITNLLSCGQTAGFTTDPGCGQQAVYDTCASALTCNVGNSTQLAQQCR